MTARTDTAAKPNSGLRTQLTRKRCACGKQVTARQLQQYECCEACLKQKKGGKGQ